MELQLRIVEKYRPQSIRFESPVFEVESPRTNDSASCHNQNFTRGRYDFLANYAVDGDDRPVRVAEWHAGSALNG